MKGWKQTKVSKPKDIKTWKEGIEGERTSYKTGNKNQPSGGNKKRIEKK